MEIREEYQIALEVCPTPLMLVSRDGRIALSNRRFDALFGYEPGELLNQPVDILVPEEIRAFHPELREAFFEVPTSRSMGTGRDLFGARKDGEMIPVEIGLDPMDQGGDSLVMVSVLDIRQRKLDEAKVRRAIDAASSAMVMINEHGKIELVNEQTESMFGYNAQDLIGEQIEMLVPARYRRKHTVYRTSYQNTRDRRAMGRGRDLYGLAKDGTEFPVEIGLTPIDGPQGRLIMATVIDITERKLSESSIQQKNDELQQLNNELKEFAYSASHDLKAPLTSITGILAFCESDLAAGDFDEVRANLERARALAERLSGRIEAMLSLARVDSVGVEDGDVVLEDAVSDIWLALKNASQQDIVLTTAFRHCDPVRTVPARLFMILENLLSNAIKYRDRTKPEACVYVESWDEDNSTCISVRDNGIGIPAEFHDKVFDLFQRIADTDKPGSGLGLALVRKNALRLGGHVTVESTKDGTVFTVFLPRKRRTEEGGSHLVEVAE